jgi:hypothetical protein
MSGEQATAALEAKTAAFGPARAPLAPATAREARMKVAELISDGAFATRYLAGNIEARRQLRSLNELIASEPDISDDTLLQADVSVGPGVDGDGPTLSRRDMLSAAAAMRAEQVWNDEGIDHILRDGKFSTEEVRDAQFYLAQMERDVTKTILCPDLPGNWTREHQVKFLRDIVTIGDGGGP